MTTIRTELQQRAQSAIIQYALFRWESAVIIAVTLILTVLLRRPFFWWPPFGWPLLGLIGLALIVYSSLIDAETNARVMLSLFQEQFNTAQLKDKTLRQQVENALEYQRRIEMQIRRQRPGLIRDRLETTANQITDWLSNVYQLGLRLDAYRNDDLLDRERNALPKEIERLTAQRKTEPNPAVQRQLDDVIAGKGKHWQTLRELDARMQQAALQMQQSLTALATIYSQVQLIDASGVDSGRAERLQADIREQVARLNDLVSSINEVYDYQSKGIE
ncbi:MAG: hypothetical protein KJZ93_10895 [Caldilineaceae bacterium]|nr:hypothetical protein [Caldilineaceae bacterium]